MRKQDRLEEQESLCHKKESAFIALFEVKLIAFVQTSKLNVFYLSRVPPMSIYYTATSHFSKKGSLLMGVIISLMLEKRSSLF